VDWHLSASAGLPASGAEAADLADSLRVSGGLFHLQRLGQRASLALRLEALLAPWGSWSELEAASPVYGIVLYPELILSVDRSVSIAARALVSPVERSALLVPGVTLSLHKGLTFLGLATLAVGDRTDTWSWERRGGVAVTAGCAYSY
jgi:hypothetical protein